MRLWYALSVVSAASAVAMMGSVMGFARARRDMRKRQWYAEAQGPTGAEGPDRWRSHWVVREMSEAGLTIGIEDADVRLRRGRLSLAAAGAAFLAVNGWMLLQLASFDAPVVPAEMVVAPLLAMMPAAVFMCVAMAVDSSV